MKLRLLYMRFLQKACKIETETNEWPKPLHVFEMTEVAELIRLKFSQHVVCQITTNTKQRIII
jgi:hypothetical protein